MPELKPKDAGSARKRARTSVRAKRYATRRELRRAVLAWCWAEVTRESPSFSVARFAFQARGWARAWARGEDDAFRRWSALREALEGASRYLDAHPNAPESNYYAAMLNGFLSSPCRGNMGDFDLSIRERAKHWPRPSAKQRWPLGDSARARLVSLYFRAPANVLWWGQRKPRTRDLAIITLLAGCWPDAAMKLQKKMATEIERPTVGQVVRAAENAVRATLARWPFPT